MPNYCFTNQDGLTVERYFGVGEAPEMILIDMSIYQRDIVAEQRTVTTEKHANWPMKSDALGVHPSQIEEAREESRKMGVPTDFTKDGRAILTSARHRKRYAEAHGIYDRNGGYGDPQRR